jgi:hypothetical protein
MSRKYVDSVGVEMNQAVQSSSFLAPGEHEVELQAMHDDGTRLVLSFKRGEDIFIQSVEKCVLEDGLNGVLGIFNKYKVKVELSEGVCAVAYGNGYNLIRYPDKSLMLRTPIDVFSIVRYLRENNLELAVPVIVGIDQL